MKKKGHYFFAFVIICIGIYFTAESFSKTEYISQGKNVGTVVEVWSKAIAASVNNEPIGMYIDGNDAEVKQGKIYMDDTMTLMVPSDILTEAFDCSVTLYKGEELVIEKGNITLKMTVDEPKLSINGAEFRMATSPVKKGNVLYVPLTVIVRGFGYTYTWDVAENKAILINDNPSAKTLPYSYSYLDRGKSTIVRDQGVRSTCWAFAAVTALETTLLPEEEYLFSVDHMSMNNSFNISQFDGGEYTMALAYLTAWQGPVLEEDDPYGDRITDSFSFPYIL